MVNWGAVTPVIVAIIGVAGVIVPAFSIPLVNQIYNRPNVELGIPSKSEYGKQIISLSNVGTMPATNLSLTVTANNKVINDITNLFSTANVTLVTPQYVPLLVINKPETIGTSLVELHVKKFVNGGGSIIKLAVGSKGATYTDYTVYVTYDQGSTKTTGGQPVLFSAAFPFVLFAVFAEYSVVVYLIIWWDKRKKTRTLQGITKEIMAVRRGLEKPSNKEIFSDEYWQVGRNTCST